MNIEPTAGSRGLRVAACSPTIQLGDRTRNLERILAVTREAVARGAQLIVLPELATSGYLFSGHRQASSLAMTRDDPWWCLLQSTLPPDAVVVVGYCESDGEKLFNSALILTEEARLGNYRKSHLWGNETSIFTPGGRAGLVADTPVGRLAVAICYDSEFPEIPRRLALAGAEILTLPVNWPLVDRPDGEHPPEMIQAMAAARSSRMATVISDRRGAEQGVQWTDGTAVISDDGWVIATRHGDIAIADLRLRADKSLPPHNDLFADRRTDLY